MADFRTKLITLTGVATVFAGMAYGQATCTPTANPVFLAGEGNVEQVADTTLTCSVAATGTGFAASTTSVNITIYVSPAVNITSATIGSGSSAKSETLAGQGIQGAAYTVTPTPGVVSANTVTFSAVPLPAIAAGGSAIITVTNIKIQASGIAITGGVPTGVLETVFVSGAPAANVNTSSTQIAVGYVANALASAKASGTTSNAICNSIATFGTVSGVVQAVGNFTLGVTEGFVDAFKIQGSSTVNTTLGSEFTNHSYTGYGTAVGSATNTATSGTELQIVFGNVPANVTVYVPLNVVGQVSSTSTTATGGSLQLVAGAGGTPVPVTTGSIASGAPGATSSSGAGTGIAAVVAISGGAGTVVYNTSAADTSGTSYFPIPVYLQASSGAVTAPSTAITAVVSLAPQISTTSTVDPNFSSTATSIATVNGSTFAACSTTLLFPFVTNQAGFDTGIALANTSADLLASSGTASLASKQSGTCVLTFFNGATTATPAFTTPAAITAGQVYANTISAMAPGFQGYVFASCNFLYAHGFAYVAYDLTQNNGVAMGYLADVLPSGRTSAIPVVTSSGSYTLATGTSGITCTAGVCSGALTGFSGNAVSSSLAAVSSTTPESWGH